MAKGCVFIDYNNAANTGELALVAPAISVDVGITVAAWIKLTDVTPNGYRPIAWFPLSSGYAYYGLNSGSYVSSSELYLEGSHIVGNHYTVTSAPNNATVGDWYYYAVTAKQGAAGETVAYLYDSDFNQVATSGAQSWSSSAGLTIPYIEMVSQALFSCQMGAKVAQARVWEAVLTEAEIEAEMMATAPVITAGLYSAFENDPAIDVSGGSHAWVTVVGAIETATVLTDDWPPNYVDAPIFAGTIPDQTYPANTPITPFDASAYFTGWDSFGSGGAFLPPGVAIGRFTGLLTGTPTTPGVYTGLIVAATNGGGTTPSNTFTITITGAPAAGGLFRSLWSNLWTSLWRVPDEP